MHLLVIEDDPRLGPMIQRLFGDDRHVVQLARDARDATELLAGGSEFDAVILDLGLPDRSGLDVLGELRRDGSDVPVMILSGSDALADRVRGLDAGADDYMVKPFEYAELEARIRALVRRIARSP